MALAWKLNADGSFDVVGGGVALQGCYPALDGAAVRPVRVTVRETADGGSLCYTLAQGELALTLGSDGPTLTVSTTLRGLPAAPHWVQPIAGARVEGADRFFRQGIGMSGPTVFTSWPPREQTDSYTVSALIAADEATLTCFTLDYRHYTMRTLLTPAQGVADAARFAIGFATECIPLPAPALTLPVLRLTHAATPWAGLHGAAREIGQAMGARTDKPTAFHWCSWYYLYQHLSEQLLDEYLAGFQALDPPVPLQTVQIDAGYFPANGDWLEANWRWPAGMPAAIAKIAAAGYRPGIWIGPFMVGNRSRLYREHPEWMLRDLHGAPLAPWRHYGEYRVWGYPDEETYVLDTSHPEAMAYLRQVFRTLRAWGVTFFKTDFILWGLQDSTGVRRHTPGKTSVEYVRDVLEMIREEIGEESFWLGCIAPYAPFIGLADAMRIAADVSDQWGAVLPNVIQETVGDQYFNNVWWQNDPDAVLVRNFHISMSREETYALALWQGMQGGVVNTSDPLHLISAERLALFRFLQPAPEPVAAVMPCWGQNRPLRIAVRAYPARQAWGVLVLNANDYPVAERLSLVDLTGQPTAHLFAWAPAGATALGEASSVLVELPPHAARLYYVTRTPTPPPNGLTLGGAMIQAY